MPVLICSGQGTNKRRTVPAVHRTLLRDGQESTLGGQIRFQEADAHQRPGSSGEKRRCRTVR